MIGHVNIVEINVKFLNGFIHVFVKCVVLPRDAWKLLRRIGNYHLPHLAVYFIYL